MNRSFLVSKYFKLALASATALISLTACHGVSYIPKSEIASLPEMRNHTLPPSLNTLPSIERSTYAAGTPISNNKSTKSFSKSKVFGAFQFKNATDDSSDDRFFVLKRRNSKFVAETILMDNAHQKSYFSIGGINGGKHAIGFKSALSINILS